MSAVCYCGQPDCPVTTWKRAACAAHRARLQAEANRDAFAAIADRAALDERARIVAWLRKWARDERSPLGLADAIERGEHEEARGG